MSEGHKKVLKQQLWNIADTFRGKMNADEFRDYILGFIFYKYLSEKMGIFAKEILKQVKVKFREITPCLVLKKGYRLIVKFILHYCTPVQDETLTLTVNQ